MRSEKDKMLAGELYVAEGPEIAADSARANAWMDRFNGRLAMPREERHAMLVELFAHAGEGAFIRPPFHCDYGYNISLGAGAFLNFGCIILDVVEVAIGEMTQIGPGVQILTADHPRDPALRRQRLEFGRPVRIGANVWVGGGALFMPGVTVGDDATVGAGAVVTRDVPAGATVVGNPARIRVPAGDVPST
ncbi:sugar O-acetyltransferase [Roseitranquillus sediminis]|uniref:sugar O-acetyltransferase n=1 Tax=Roseitranquillus sediminis TaxID=2809051 RepID=UPI001D0C1D74|nr:sugar O-acetyltransferase [Roseitranquillus sediminis]MBM9593913.1 sugar O-acetyltransferase [Roseitranquillus sediminis]